MFENFLILFSIFLSALLGVLIFPRPYLGVVFTAASLAVVDLLPSIPLFSSVAPLIGAVTLVGYMFQNTKKSGKVFLKIHAISALSFLFILWMFITNPQAAWFGWDRNWVLTFAQLWFLAFLSGDLLDTTQKHRVFFWVFSIVAAVSAFVAIQQGYINEDISIYARSTGLAEGANAAARYFVVGMISFSYLRINEKKRRLGLIATIGMIVTFLGVFFTVSRTGMVLLFTAIVLMILFNPQKKKNFLLIVIFIIAIFTLTLMSDSIFKIIESIIPSISLGTDTIGLRYKLWGAGWRMWQDYPLQGVGIGMFPVQLRYYAGYEIPAIYWRVVTHNMYLQVLSETGIIGFVIFMAMIIITLRNLSPKHQKGDTQGASLQTAWLIIFIVMLLGGITMNQSADKIIWIVMGASSYFSGINKNQTQEISLTENTEVGPYPTSRISRRRGRPALKNNRMDDILKS